MLRGIPAPELPPFVPSLWPLLEKICARWEGKFTPDDVLRAIEREEFQLWGWVENGALIGALLTRITVYPRMKVLEHVGLAGPDRRTWLDHHSLIEAFGRAHGCTRIEAEGRGGWVKVMEPFGFRPTRTVIAKDL